MLRILVRDHPSLTEIDDFSYSKEQYALEAIDKIKSSVLLGSLCFTTPSGRALIKTADFVAAYIHLVDDTSAPSRT